MVTCSQDPSLCWATRFLGVISILSACRTSANSAGAHGSGIKDSRTHTYLERIRGGSVLFHVIRDPGEDLGPNVEEVTWGIGPDSDSTFILRVQNGTEVPKWFSLQNKYQQRVQLCNMTSLRIDNLTSEDSGQYWAQVSLNSGKVFSLVFHLTVYDPVPPSQIRNKSPSFTPSWCNVTLECGAVGTKEVLNVTWESKDLPRELEQKGEPGPAPNPWTLSVSLPLSQPTVSITCVVSNHVDQKNATVDLVDICSQDSHGKHIPSRSRVVTLGLLAVLLILGVGGVFFWKFHKKRKIMDMERGTELQEAHRVEDDIHYAQLMEQESQ